MRSGGRSPLRDRCTGIQEVNERGGRAGAKAGSLAAFCTVRKLENKGPCAAAGSLIWGLVQGGPCVADGFRRGFAPASAVAKSTLLATTRTLGSCCYPKFTLLPAGYHE